MSMELIDSNKLIDYFFYGIDEKPITGSTETDEKVIQVIQSQETVKAIPLDRVEQIREEIAYAMDMEPAWKGQDNYVGGLEIALSIIDKAIKEQTGG